MTACLLKSNQASLLLGNFREDGKGARLVQAEQDKPA